LERGVDLEMPMAVIYNPAGVPDEFVEAAPPTTGDMLAGVAPFVLHYSEFEHTAPELMFDDDRDGALRVHFAVGSSRLDENRGQNAATLKALIDAINVLQEASDSKVRNIVIAGFASPEGSFALNDRLAWSRATVLKRYIMRRCAIDGDVIHIHNGIEDWHGLKLMVESSDLETKDQVLHIIENVPIWDAKRQTGREEEFMKLDRGVTYRHMLRNFYPELRKAAYIKIYYGNESE
jgi:hypothetical protein